MAITLPSKKQKGKHYVSTKRPNIKFDSNSAKETKTSFDSDTHGVHGEKTEHFSKLKKLLKKKMI